MNRRQLLQYASLFAATGVVSVGTHGWAARSLAATVKSKRLIVIFLRGAVDGLNVVVPYREADYYTLRPTLAIGTPTDKDGAIDLDGRFGLNPALAALMPLWENRSLAFVNACGSPDSTRSHFDAQFDWESGTPGAKRTTDGWMNRVLAALPQGTLTQAVNVGNTTPHILAGSMSVANLPAVRNPENALAIDRPQIDEAFDRLYNGTDPLSRAYQEGEAARKILLENLQTEMQEADGNAPRPEDGFVRDARRMARLMVSDARTQLGFMELGGWDTHVNQNTRLTKALAPVAEGLAALVEELGSAYEDTTIAVISEFGRTVAENGNAGTDHGRGNVMWLLGGGIRGGQVLGTWPGLAPSQQFEGRDLEITTDFRDVMTLLFKQHLQISPAKLASIFPEFRASSDFNLWG
ncbi:MAG: DUF1501 domain-containing protein [Geitlerinemataceae cyanobacterium]